MNKAAFPSLSLSCVHSGNITRARRSYSESDMKRSASGSEIESPDAFSFMTESSISLFTASIAAFLILSLLNAGKIDVKKSDEKLFE